MIQSVIIQNNAMNDSEKARFYGKENAALDFVMENQLKDLTLWRDFVDVFRRSPDDVDDGWRGEYWGKMMRGACMSYECTHSYELYRILTNTVYDMMSTQDKFGRISSYSLSNEFHGWDMWCRKYVMLGMEYYIDICKDKRLIAIIIDCIKRQADYIIEKIGDNPGQIGIFETTNWWGGLNSSSVLEPFVRLYNLTKQQKYLAFAEYLIEKGFCSKLNIIQACLHKTLYPYQFPYTKAYEMMSCFEGLLEYYRIKGGEDYLRAVVNFVDMVAETDVTVIGCCGCTHELFDHSAVKQTEPPSEFIMQETCVTVTWMKLCFNLLKLTGDSKYAALIEQSGYNALLGAVNVNLNDLKLCENQTENLNNGVKFIFDSYSPLYYDQRGKKIGGFKDYKDNYYYGCCNCIGSAGVAVLNKFGVMETSNGIVVNNYKRSKISTDKIAVNIYGNLNKNGHVNIRIVSACSDDCEIRLLIPTWLDNYMIKINGKITAENKLFNGYVILTKKWNIGDEIQLCGKVNIRSIVLNNKIAFQKGAVVLARDENDNGDFYAAIHTNARLVVGKSDLPHEYCYETLVNDKKIKFIDYASAGQQYDNLPCKITVWSDILDKKA